MKNTIFRKVLACSIFLSFLSILTCSLSFVWCPRPDAESIITFGVDPIDITGVRFGDNPRTGDDYLVKVRNSIETVIDSHDSRILTWTDSLIVYDDPATSDGSFDLYVVREWDPLVLASEPVAVDMYEYTNYPLTVPPGDSGYPIDLAFDSQGTLWVTSEFSQNIYSLAPLASNLVAHTVPQPVEFIFVSGWFPDRKSSLSEDVEVDSDDNIWFTQGGEYLYSGGEINASRIVKYDPVMESYLCYNIPANNAEIFGLYLDEEEDTVWVAAGNGQAGNFISSFLPDTFSSEQSSCLYNFRSTFPADFCSGEETDGCFKRYDMLTSSTNPAHIIEISDGYIWTSQFFGNRITRTDPSTEDMVEYVMPESSGTSQQAQAVGSGPWSLVLYANKLWILESFDNQLVEFNLTTNTVVHEHTIPNWDPDYDFAHTLIFDGDDYMWFSMYTTPMAEGTGWLGRFNHNHKFEMAPPLPSLGIIGGTTGLAIEQSTGDLYFGIFWMARVGRLHRLE